MATPRTSMTVASVVSISIVSTARRSSAANPLRQRPHGRDVDLAVEREGRGATDVGGDVERVQFHQAELA
jgi:hypothetical protein